MQVLTGRDAVRTLADRRLEAVPFAENYDQLAAALGLDFGAISELLRHVPLCLRGTMHERGRGEIARLMAEATPALDPRLPEIVARHFAPLTGTGTGTETVDVLEDCIVPCVDEIVGHFVGVPLVFEPDSLLSRLFSDSHGIARRRRLQAEIVHLLEVVARAFPQEGRDMHLYRLALAVLGRDALIGTLGRSLHAHLTGAGAQGAALPVTPTHTGVPYILREAMEEIDDATLGAGIGEIVRCELSTLEGGNERERLRFFSSGRHVCLGRSFVLGLFGHVSAFLERHPARVRVTGYALRKDDCFLYPGRFEVEVSPAPAARVVAAE